MGKVDHMQEQMGDVSQEKKILRKYPKKVQEIKTTVTERRISYQGENFQVC